MADKKIEDTTSSALIDNESKKEESKVAAAPAKDNPKLGVFFYILSGISFALNFIFAKVIYESKPQTTSM